MSTNAVSVAGSLKGDDECRKAAYLTFARSVAESHERSCRSQVDFLVREPSLTAPLTTYGLRFPIRRPTRSLTAVSAALVLLQYAWTGDT